MSTTRRRVLDDTFKKSVVGNPAVAQGSLARRGPGIVMEGWTKQDSTTGAQLLDEKQLLMSDAYWQYKDGEFIGTNAASTYVYTLMKLLPAEYVFSVYCVEMDGIGKLEIRYAGKTIAKKTFENVGRKEISFVAEEGKTYRLLFGDNGNGSMTYSRPMLNTGSTALPYEPYTGGAPSPSPNYPQEIVSAGNRNEAAQKWEYEIEVSGNDGFSQTVTLTSDRSLTKWDRLEKRGGQWGWVYKSEEIESYTDGGVPGEYFSTTGQLSVGAQVWYETTTETFVPLTASEQEAMNALHTYRPTTVLSNQQDCEMALTYKSRKGVGGVIHTD